MADLQARIKKLKQVDLTRRQRRILHLHIDDKLTYADIAESISHSENLVPPLAERTIRDHMQNIFTKLNLHGLSRIKLLQELVEYNEALKQLEPEEGKFVRGSSDSRALVPVSGVQGNGPDGVDLTTLSAEGEREVREEELLFIEVLEKGRGNSRQGRQLTAAVLQPALQVSWFRRLLMAVSAFLLSFVRLMQSSFRTVFLTALGGIVGAIAVVMFVRLGFGTFVQTSGPAAVPSISVAAMGPASQDIARVTAVSTGYPPAVQTSRAQEGLNLTATAQSTPRATATSTAVPTDTPKPTAVPTDTPKPTVPAIPTAIPQTPVDAALDFGQTWTGQGLKLTASSPPFSGYSRQCTWGGRGPQVDFILTNSTNSSLNFQVLASTFYLKLSTGKRYPGCPAESTYDLFTFNDFSSGQNAKFSVVFNVNWDTFQADKRSLDVTYYQVGVADFHSRLLHAVWQEQVLH
ncbi:MAG: hypothetical protein Q7O66_21385 [Dehalococcoidia bacterium]|nr:hypothetical protein [Dehalococcoidia bacterium]